MKKLFILFGLLTLIVAGCQVEVPTVVPNPTARVSREILLDGTDGKTVIGEATYHYNSAGNLAEIKRYAKDGTGSLSLYAYELYEYDSNNRVVNRLDYYRNQTATGTDFMLSEEQQFQYPTENQIISQTYGYSSGRPWLRKWVETTTKNRQPIQAVSYNPGNDGVSRGFLSIDVTYVYENGRLAKQEYRNDRNELYQTNERRYNGRVAEVFIVYPGQKKGFVLETLEYDQRGRLIRQQYMSQIPQYKPTGATLALPITQFDYND